MLRSNLYNTVLLDPACMGADELFAISGYASATFTRRHIVDLLNISGGDKKINLIIGMPKKISDHKAFLNIISNHSSKFSGYYYDGRPSVHCKLYSWFDGEAPVSAFSGSANYSQYGFFEEKQQNQVADDDPIEIRDYYFELLNNSVAIRDAIVEDSVSGIVVYVEGSILPGSIEWLVEDVSVRISLLTRSGGIARASGLNWGQRLDNHGNQREPNQAYLSIKQDARKEGFLPERGFTFTMLTDDGQSLDCTVQQDGRKGVTTTENNSILGRYIRNRLNLNDGDFVIAVDLVRYGRTDFTLTKIDDETFLFDMSV